MATQVLVKSIHCKETVGNAGSDPLLLLITADGKTQGFTNNLNDQQDWLTPVSWKAKPTSAAEVFFIVETGAVITLQETYYAKSAGVRTIGFANLDFVVGLKGKQKKWLNWTGHGSDYGVLLEFTAAPDPPPPKTKAAVVTIPPPNSGALAEGIRGHFQRPVWPTPYIRSTKKQRRRAVDIVTDCCPAAAGWQPKYGSAQEGPLWPTNLTCDCRRVGAYGAPFPNPTEVSYPTDLRPWPASDAVACQCDIAKQIIVRIANPFLIAQMYANFCGPAAVIFELACRDPETYAALCIECYDEGKVSGFLEDYVCPPQICYGPFPTLKFYKDVNGTCALDFKQEIAVADWIIMSTIRGAMNLILEKVAWAVSVGSSGSNMGNISQSGMKDMALNLLGISGLTDVGYVPAPFGDTEEEVVAECLSSAAHGSIGFLNCNLAFVVEKAIPSSSTAEHWISVLFDQDSDVDIEIFELKEASDAATTIFDIAVFSFRFNWHGHFGFPIILLKTASNIDDGVFGAVVHLYRNLGARRPQTPAAARIRGLHAACRTAVSSIEGADRGGMLHL